VRDLNRHFKESKSGEDAALRLIAC